jgi:membrane-bound inhibitor of C-type lysozyme
VAVVQYTFTNQQYTEQHHATEHTEQNKCNNTKITVRNCEAKRILGIPEVDRRMLLLAEIGMC